LVSKLNKSKLGLEEILRHDPKFDVSMFGGCIANYCNPRSWVSSRKLTEELKPFEEERRVHLALGCHPHFAGAAHFDSLALAQLELVVKEFKRRVVAVGECGLDYSRKNAVEKSRQKRVFVDQVKLAMRLQLPLVLHIREAEEDSLDILEEVGLPPDWRIHRHCFTGDWKTAERWLDLFPGSKLGVTAAVMDTRNYKVHDWVSKVPLTKLLLETDSPYFPPGGHTRDVSVSLPGDILYLAEQVATMKKISLVEVLTANLCNVKEIYGVIPVVQRGRVEKEAHSLNKEEGVEVVKAKLGKVEQNTNVKCENRNGVENNISKISHVKEFGDIKKEKEVEVVKAKLRKECIAGGKEQQIETVKRNNISHLKKSQDKENIQTAKYKTFKPWQCRGRLEDDGVLVVKAKISKVK